MTVPQENDNQESLSSFKCLMRLPLRQRIIKAWRFARGLWVTLTFDTKGLIDAGRRIRIAKQNGETHLDRYCRIYDDLHIAVAGDSPHRKATLCIGTDSGIAVRTKINVTDSVTTGNHCSIGWDCDIWDTSWHRVRFPDRKAGPISKPVVIEDHVWIGSHTIVQRGVTIGTNSIIAAGPVVIKDIPPNSFAVGNPARVLEEIVGWGRDPHKVHGPQGEVK